MMELIRDQMEHWEKILDTDHVQEETQEAIVPDACPDIRQIVEVNGQICLTEKHPLQDGVSFAGHVNVSVLYLPEEGQAIRRMEVNLPYSVRLDAAGVDEYSACAVLPAVCGMDAAALNPRKILLRAKLLFRVRAWQLCRATMSREVECGDGDGVQQLQTETTAFLTAAIKGKEFLVDEELRLSAGPAGEAQILSLQAEAACLEAKVIGTKLILKGELVLQALYQAGGELCCARGSEPWSEIIESGELGEDAECDVDVCVKAVDYARMGEDGRSLSVTAQLLAQAVLYRKSGVTLLQDAYSVTRPILVEREKTMLAELLDHNEQTLNVHEEFQTEQPASSVICTELSLCDLTQHREDDKTVFDARFRLNVLYLDEQGQYHHLEQTFTASGRMEAPPSCGVSCRARCVDEAYAVPSPGGIELRFHLEFKCRVTQEREHLHVTALKPGPESADGAPRPSVVLRMTRPGERVWDVAKSYSTTTEKILQANGLAGEPLPAGKMLLIPNAR